MDQDPSFSAGEEVPAGAITGRTGPLGVLAGRGLPSLPDDGAAGGATPEEGPTLGGGSPAAARFSVLGRRLVTSARSAFLVPGRSSQLASAVHVASLAGAFAFWAWLDRGLWFFGDEWQFLLDRGLSYAPGSRKGIWFPHNEHWSTLPVLLWRGLYSAFHLGTYWPYILPVLLAQVGVMHLAWRLCKRAGVDAWTATAAVVVLGLLGAGAEDLAWGFQIGFVGSVLFGLLAFDLLEAPVRKGAARSGVPAAARRDGDLSGAGPRDRGPSTAGWRDALASVSMLASLMCSTIGDAMVVGAAVVLFARRPRQRALRVLALPVASWAVWFGFLGHRGLGSRADQLHLSTITGLPTYVWTGLSSALGQAFNLQSAGAAVLVGLGAWAVWHMRPLWQEKPALLGLCVAAVMFYVLAGLGRDALGDSVAVSRYVYVAIAILVPVIAGVLSSAGGWPGARLAAVALLAATALGNVGQAQSYLAARDLLVDNLKTDVAGTAQLLAAGVRDVAGPGAEPISHEPNLDASGLAGLARSGLLPHETLGPAQLVNARTLLAVSLSPHPLSSGRFVFLGTSYSVPSRKADGCMVFSPQTVSPPVQVWLGLLPGEMSASVHVSTAPTTGGVARYLAGVLVPASGPATTDPAELAMPPRGSAYLSYNDPGTRLALLWDAGTPLTFCGLAPGPAG